MAGTTLSEHLNAHNENVSQINSFADDTVWGSECNLFYAECCLDNGTQTELCENETFYVNSYNDSSPYLMPWPQRTGWIAVFAVMLAVATVGNALVAWIVFGKFAASAFQLTSDGQIRFGLSRLALIRFDF